jgi:hypothetical protein
MTRRALAASFPTLHAPRSPGKASFPRLSAARNAGNGVRAPFRVTRITGNATRVTGNVIRSPGNASFPLLRTSFPRGNTARSPGKTPRRAHPTAERRHHAEPRIPEIPSRKGLTDRSTGIRLCTSLPSVKSILLRTLKRRRLGRGLLRIAGLRRRIRRRASLPGFPPRHGPSSLKSEVPQPGKRERAVPLASFPGQPSRIGSRSPPGVSVSGSSKR